MLRAIDTRIRQIICLVVDTSKPAPKAPRNFEPLIAKFGQSTIMLSDNEAGLILRGTELGADTDDVSADYSTTEKPVGNSFIGAFKSTPKEPCQAP